jgi:hypothetical protein
VLTLVVSDIFSINIITESIAQVWQALHYHFANSWRILDKANYDILLVMEVFC